MSFYSFKSADTNVWIHESRENWENILLYLVSERKRIVVPTNRGRNWIEILTAKILRYWPEARIQAYHAYTPKATKRDVANCNTLWTEVDILIYSPTISSGVNFEPGYPYFHYIMPYATHRSSCARVFMQQIKRVRECKNRTIIWTCEGDNPETEAKKIAKQEAKGNAPVLAKEKLTLNEVDLWKVKNETYAKWGSLVEKDGTILKKDGFKGLTPKFIIPKDVKDQYEPKMVGWELPETPYTTLWLLNPLKNTVQWTIFMVNSGSL